MEQILCYITLLCFCCLFEIHPTFYPIYLFKLVIKLFKSVLHTLFSPTLNRHARYMYALMPFYVRYCVTFLGVMHVYTFPMIWFPFLSLFTSSSNAFIHPVTFLPCNPPFSWGKGRKCQYTKDGITVNHKFTGALRRKVSTRKKRNWIKGKILLDLNDCTNLKFSPRFSH